MRSNLFAPENQEQESGAGSMAARAADPQAAIAWSAGLYRGAAAQRDLRHRRRRADRCGRGGMLGGFLR
jgi:hypothetical protein